jgi:hypothetical protein
MITFIIKLDGIGSCDCISKTPNIPNVSVWNKNYNYHEPDGWIDIFTNHEFLTKEIVISEIAECFGIPTDQVSIL